MIESLFFWSSHQQRLSGDQNRRFFKFQPQLLTIHSTVSGSIIGKHLTSTIHDKDSRWLLFLFCFRMSQLKIIKSKRRLLFPVLVPWTSSKSRIHLFQELSSLGLLPFLNEVQLKRLFLIRIRMLKSFRSLRFERFTGPHLWSSERSIEEARTCFGRCIFLLLLGLTKVLCLFWHEHLSVDLFRTDLCELLTFTLVKTIRCLYLLVLGLSFIKRFLLFDPKELFSLSLQFFFFKPWYFLPPFLSISANRFHYLTISPISDQKSSHIFNLSSQLYLFGHLCNPPQILLIDVHTVPKKSIHLTYFLLDRRVQIFPWEKYKARRIVTGRSDRSWLFCFQRTSSQSRIHNILMSILHILTVCLVFLWPKCSTFFFVCIFESLQKHLKTRLTDGLWKDYFRPFSKP